MYFANLTFRFNDMLYPVNSKTNYQDLNTLIFKMVFEFSDTKD